MTSVWQTNLQMLHPVEEEGEGPGKDMIEICNAYVADIIVIQNDVMCRIYKPNHTCIKENNKVGMVYESSICFENLNDEIKRVFFYSTTILLMLLIDFFLVTSI